MEVGEVPHVLADNVLPGIPDDRRVDRDECGGQIRVPAGQLEGDVASHALSLAPMLWPADLKTTDIRASVVMNTAAL
jgi:hypothetical protein